MNMQVGDRVVVQDVQNKSEFVCGTVRYIGTLQVATGEWVGIELTEASGKNDGTVKGQRYFTCPDKYGIFLRREKITKVLAAGEPFPTKGDALHAPVPQAAPASATNTKQRGSTATTGTTAAKASGPTIKNLLPEAQEPPTTSPKASPKASPRGSKTSVTEPKVKTKPQPNGAAEPAAAAAPAPKSGQQAGSPSSAAAPAAKPAKQVNVRDSLTESKDVPVKDTSSEIPADDSDSLPAFQERSEIYMFSHPCTVRYVGSVKFAPGIWVGLEFHEAVGKCDGSIGGVEYFKTMPNRAIFLLAPNVSPEAVQGGGSRAARKMSTSSARMVRKMSSRSRAQSRASSMSGDMKLKDEPADPNAIDWNDIDIRDDEGNPVSIEDLVQAFEDSQAELEGITELLNQAEERERNLREELAAARNASENTGPPRGDFFPKRGSVASLAPVPALAPAPVGVADIFDNVIMLSDSYKVTHHLQYPPNTQTVYSYFECRGGRFEDVCFFGLQYYLKKYFVGPVITPEKILVAERFFRDHFSHPQFGYDKRLFNKAGWEYILKEHGGNLPVVIRSVPEGTVVPFKNVLFTVENTDPKCFWLTNYLETLLAQVWYPTTVCTQSREQKNIIAKYLRETGSEKAVNDGSYKFKLHDFGFRGVSSVESSAVGGAGHLVNFLGSDTMSALILSKEFYRCDCAAFSIPASEHSTITTWGREREVDAMRNMLESYPTGLVACVSDSYDVFNACENLWGGELKEKIESRDGCLVVRPDSGELPGTLLEVLEKLAGKFNCEKTSTGHKLLPSCIRVIQGDGIDIDSLEVILKAMQDAGWAADNVAFGSGGALLQKLHRDTEKCAFKCSYARIDDKDVNVFKDPVTDPGKKSKPGRLTLECNDGVWTTVTEGKGDPDKDRLVEVFRDGKLIVDDSLMNIRKRSEGVEVAPVLAKTLEDMASGMRRRAPNMPPPPSAKPKRTGTKEMRVMQDKVKSLADSVADRAGKLRAIKGALEKKDQERDAARKQTEEKDIEMLVQVWDENKGDIDALVKLFDLNAELVRKKEPKDSRDFATKLLRGDLTGDRTVIQLAELRGKIHAMIPQQRTFLKKTQTKVRNSLDGADDSEILLVSAIFTDNNGDLAKIAERYELSLEKMQSERLKPKDAYDFGKRLLAGDYSEDKSAVAKQNLRDRLQMDLKAQISKLKKTTTKEWTGGASREDIERFMKFYRDNRGHLESIARAVGASVSLLKGKPPVDDEDFAKRLLAGEYTGDETQIAKVDLRKRLEDDIANWYKNKTPTRTVTRTYTGEANEMELSAVAKVYHTYHGDLEELSKHFGCDIDELRTRAPKDAMQFAKGLFSGLYCRDKAEFSKNKLREKLFEEIMKRMKTLRKTQTKVGGDGTEITELDLEFAGKIYTECNGNVDEMAKRIGCTRETIEKHRPQDARDFATQLFQGHYSEDKSAMAIDKLRTALKRDLNQKIQELMKEGRLEPAVNKSANTTVSIADIQRIAKVYTQHRGNADQMVKQFHIIKSLLESNPPKNAEDFAKRLLDGQYTGDTSAIARAQLKSSLKIDLQVQASQLKRTDTKVKDGGKAVSDDVAKFAEVYNHFKGNVEDLCKTFNLEKEIVLAKPPKSPEDFATKLLEGNYSDVKMSAGWQKAKFRRDLDKNIQDLLPKLKRTNTKVGTGEASKEDIDVVAKVFEKLGGNLSKIARAVGLDPAVLDANPPTDGTDFAKKLLRGDYTVDKSAAALNKLRDDLKAELQRQSTLLRRSTTKVWDGKALPADVARMAKVWNDCRGNFEKIAAQTGANLGLLKKRPPQNEREFAERMLAGEYTASEVEMVKAEFRAGLMDDIQDQPGKLKRTVTKEGGQPPSDEELKVVREIFNANDGNLGSIAKFLKVEYEVFMKHPPKDADDFARKLLDGTYSVDRAAQVKEALRKELEQGLQKQRTELKRTQTKEATGKASEEDLLNVIQWFRAQEKKGRGSIDHICEQLCLSKMVVAKNPWASERDFAEKLLDGTYVADLTEDAKNTMRAYLEDDIRRQITHLKRTSTKVADGAPLCEDILKYAKIWADHRGNLESLAKAMDIPLSLLQSKAPKGGEDFAGKLLRGEFAADKDAMAKKDFRADLAEDLQATTGQLKRTQTKEAGLHVEASEADVQAISVVWSNCNGDLAKIAETLHISKERLMAEPPADGQEFAKNLLKGLYTVESDLHAQATWRNHLAEDILKRKNTLKRVQTKTGNGQTTAEDRALFEKFFKKHDGNLRNMARDGTISMQLLMDNPPKDATDFADKMLQGQYTLDSHEHAKSQLRDRLEEEVKRMTTQLRKTKTKVGDGQATAEDISAISAIYQQYRGNAESLAAHYGLHVELINKNPPTSGDDFARKLLEGIYAGERSDIARGALRKTLGEDINVVSSTLRRVTTKECQGPLRKDVEDIATIYRTCKGTQALASKFNIKVKLLEQSPPESAEDFAVKFLKGVYTEDEAMAAKADWRDRLAEDLQAAPAKLKRTETKVGKGEPTEEDIKLVAKVWEKSDGDLYKLCKLTNAEVDLVEKKPPANAEEFARMYLQGFYFRDQIEGFKTSLRDRLKEDLERTLTSGLKRTTTKEGPVDADPETISGLVQLYNKRRGDLEALAEVCECSVDLLRQFAPSTAEEFATNLLRGQYHGDKLLMDKQALRNRLREDIISSASNLKRTITRENTQLSDKDKDLKAASDVFQKHRGDLDKIATALQLKYALLVKDAPSTATDFAKGLLMGKYHADDMEMNKMQLRARLHEDLNRSMTRLRRTETKEATGEPNKEDIEFMSKIYATKNGNHQELAEYFGLSLKKIEKNPPKSGEDFAYKTFTGLYTLEAPEAAKQDLMSGLGEQLTRAMTAGLRRTQTKEGGGDKATDQDIEFIAGIYNNHRGNLVKLSAMFGANVELMKKNSPASAEDFAKKLLEGLYTGDTSAAAMKQFRDLLKKEIEAQRSQLRKTQTKEYSGPSEEDIIFTSTIFTANKGDLAKIAKATGCDQELLEENPPVDETDFATRLLNGAFAHHEDESSPGKKLTKSQKRNQRRAKSKAKAKAKAAAQAEIEKELEEAREKKRKKAENDRAAAAAAPTVAPTAEQMEAMERLYEKHQGDLDKIAEVAGILPIVIHADPPTSANDFAKKLLGGLYAVDADGLDFKAKLARQKTTLQRTKTKEATGEASEQDLQQWADFYTKYNGDLAELAKALDVEHDLLEQSRPRNAKDFAKRLLEGRYHGDKNAMNQAKFRTGLVADIKSQKTGLKRTQTKDKTSSNLADFVPAKEMVDAVVDIWNEKKGDLDELAKHFGILAAVLKEKAPADGEKFALDLFQGKYAVDQSDKARADLRKDLRELIPQRMATLKRTNTKEATGEASKEDLEAIAKLWSDYKADTDKMAELYGLSTTLLEKFPPEDAEDFARKLLNGTYTSDRSEEAKAALRERLDDQLKRQMTSLRRTQTKVADGEASVEDMSKPMQYYTYCKGDIAKLCQMCGLNPTLVERAPPRDAEDFARKFLLGVYSAEKSDIAKEYLRDNMAVEIKDAKKGLKRTATKERSLTDLPDESMMRDIMEIYDSLDGSLEELAKKFGVWLMILKEKAPKDSKDFAIKLLRGEYLADRSDKARTDLRKNLMEDLSAMGSKLKRTTTKEPSLDVSPEDLEAVAKKFDELDSNLDKLAEFYKISRVMLEKRRPADGKQFALQLFAGSYTEDKAEAAKDTLRQTLQDDLDKAPKLKRTQTKEGDGKALSEDIVYFADFFAKYSGNMEKISAKLGLSADLVRKHPPGNKHDFAKKLLEGVYVADEELTAFSKQTHMERMRREIERTATNLKRTTTREAQGPSQEAIDSVTDLFNRYEGDFEVLSSKCGISIELLKKHPPKSGKDFAIHLLEGAYTLEMTEAGKAAFRMNLLGDIEKMRGKLTRTMTRGPLGPTSEELTVMARFYVEAKGDMDALAGKTGQSAELLKAMKPLSAEEFAQHALQGSYIQDKSETAKAAMRLKLAQEVKFALSGLKRTQTKDLNGEVFQEDITQFAKIWAQYDGNYDKLALHFGVSATLIKQYCPQDGRMFAKHLLEGFYTGDTGDLARKKLRDRLQCDLQAKAAALTHVTTKDFSSGPSREDVEAVAAFWEKHNGDSFMAGDIANIAKAFDINQELVMKNPPRDGTDFAHKVFEGVYTGDTTKQGQAQVLAGMQTKLQRQMTNLKRTVTRTYTGVSEDDVRAVQAIYARHSGDLEKLAELAKLPVEALKRNPPKDAKDFAHKMLSGAYLVDTTEDAKRNFRSQLHQDLQMQSRHLRKTSTRGPLGPSREELEVARQVYLRNSGDERKIAQELKVPLSHVRNQNVKNADDFARKFLNGAFEYDRIGEAKHRMRIDLLGGMKLEKQKTLLRQTKTKEFDGELNPRDVEEICKLYDESKADVNKVAMIFGIPVAVLQNKPPADGTDFAKKYLLGSYDVNVEQKAKEEFRGTLQKTLTMFLQGQSQKEGGGSLKRTETKTYSGKPKEDEIARVAAQYDKFEGDYHMLANVFGVNEELMHKTQPSDAFDFAEKLLMGVYSDESSEAIRRRLQQELPDQLKLGRLSLKRTHTREGNTDPRAADMDAIAKIYQENAADLGRVATLVGCSVEVLRKNPPADATEFAWKFLLGLYEEHSSTLFVSV